MSNFKVKAGILFFKYRSFLPLPLILVIFLLFRPGHWPAAAPVLTICGFLLAAAGESIRVLAVGYSAPGTSGRESFLRADQLNTRGVYSIVRNPLYIGNILIYSGLLLAFGNPLAFFLGLAFVAGEYLVIVAAEERYLRERYGDLYVDYCRLVRRWLPRFGRYSPPQGKFQLKKVLFKENDSLFNFLFFYLSILAYRERHLSGRIRHPLALGLAALLLAASYAAVKIQKKRDRSSRPDAAEKSLQT